ncbi:MAG TPA: LacI family DNA-binding transcriptional regulator [Actinomycetota bacterium]
MSARRPSIHDIARQAEVSVATVSRVLNDKPDVSPETRDRVRTVLESAGYQLNRAAVSLSTGRTSLIALVLGELTAFSETVEIERAIVRRAAEVDYGAVLWLSDLDTKREARYADLLTLGSVDGAIVAAIREEGPLLERLGDKTLPLVLVEPKDVTPGLTSVRTDHRRAAELAMEHLLELGHRRIGLVTLREGWAMGVQQLDGYRSALRAAGVSLDESLVVRHLWWEEMGYEAGHRSGLELLGLAEPPTAIVTCGDNVALGVMDAARSLGKRVPADLSLVGYDDIPMAASMRPGLTTLRRRAARLGEMAAETLFRLIDGDEGVQDEILIPTELEVRGSTGPPPS